MLSRSVETADLLAKVEMASHLRARCDYALCLAVSQQAADGFSDDLGSPTDLRLRNDLRIAECLTILGQGDEASLLLSSLEGLLQGSPSLLGMCHSLQAWNLFHRGLVEDALALLARAIDELRSVAGEEFLSETHRWTAYAFRASGNIDEALRCMYESIGAAQRRQEPTNVAIGQLGLARMLRSASRYEESGRMLDSAFRHFESICSLSMIHRISLDQATVSRLRGNLCGAETWGRRALTIAEEHEGPLSVLLSQIGLNRVHALRQGSASLEFDATDVVVAAERERLFHPLVLGLEDRGDHAYEDGRFAEALSDYNRAFALIESPEKGEYPGELAWRIGLTHLQLGDLPSAEEWITRGLDICEKTGDAKEHAVTIRAHGVLLIARGQTEAGFAQLQDALERLQRLGVPFEVGRTHLEFARVSALFPKNAATPCGSHLESAKAIFTKMGSGLGLRWVEELADKLNSPAAFAATAASLGSALPPAKRPTPPRPYGPPISESLLDEYLEFAPVAPRTLRFASTTLGIPWRAPMFLEALDHLRHFSRSKAPLLIQGETGTGKTAFAEAAHLLGRNSTEPFLVVNCASLPESLLESELFGHVRGAFTGAERDKPGLIRSAGAGTIFLDEVDKASSSFQANLLHVLDRREIRALGSHSYQEVRARFVLATNRDLAQLSHEGKFLSDLEFRISGLRVDLPPLRDRFSDLDLLLALALRELRLHEGITKSIHTEARHFLASYAWPGNVRELFSVVTAAALLAPDDLQVLGRVDIERAFKHGRRHAHLHRAARAGDLASRMDELEREELLLVLRLEGGNQSSASRKLGITRRGLNKKLHRLGLIEQLDAEGLKYHDSRTARGAAAKGPAGVAAENETGLSNDHDENDNEEDDSFLENV